MTVIETLYNETRVFPPSPSFSKLAAISDMATYQALCTEAEQDIEGFWGRLARSHLYWHQPFTRMLDATNPPFYKWFEDGLINASYNCIDRHLQNGLADKTALIFEAEDGVCTSITYRALYHRVCKLANALKAFGIKKGDRIVIYMAMSLEGIIAMQACARIGAIHSVVFAGFSAKSLRERIVDIGAIAVVTADGQWRSGKQLPLKSVVDEALALGGCDSVKHVVVHQRTYAEVAWYSGRDFWLHQITADMLDVCEPEWVSAEHPLFILYTSGSTGKPKGIQHSTGGYLLWCTVTMQWTFDIKNEDLFWCTADIGWITGHSYIAYGPLAAGATQLIFEGAPSYPHAGRFWHMIAHHKVTIFYTAPTAIRSLIKAVDIDERVHPKNYDLSSLRLLGSVGEPINPEAWMWYYRHVGREQCPIVDTFWQTETGGHMISPLPGAMPLVPGSCCLPLPGIKAAVVDEFGYDMPHGQGGLLVIKKPWPSMVRTIWGDANRFKENYFPNELGGQLYLAGDGAIRNKDTGYFTITGRIDDVLNISGHRLGTMEIESALAAHPMVVEAAVVGRADEVTGEAIVAFVVLKNAWSNSQETLKMAEELRAWVAKEIGVIAKPKELRFGDNLPKTRSGKIMRRLLRTLASGEPITQDISSLENPAILTQFSLAQ